MTRSTIATVAAMVITFAVAGPFAAGIVAISPLLIGRLIRVRAQRAEVAARQRALPIALDLLVITADAGLTPAFAVELLARSGPPATRPAFEAVMRRVAHGEPLGDALAVLPARLGRDAIPAADALALAQRRGAPLRDALHVIAAEAARQRRAHAEASARQLPVRLAAPLVVCVLPAFVLLSIAPAVLAAFDTLLTTDW